MPSDLYAGAAHIRDAFDDLQQAWAEAAESWNDEVSRCCGEKKLEPLGPIVNVVSGTARYPYRRFLVYDVIGESIWVVLYLSLGYAFGANWELLVDLLSNATQALTLLVVVGILAFFLIRALRQRHQHEDEEPATPGADDQTEPEGVGASAQQ